MVSKKLKCEVLGFWAGNRWAILIAALWAMARTVPVLAGEGKARLAASSDPWVAQKTSSPRCALETVEISPGGLTRETVHLSPPAPVATSARPAPARTPPEQPVTRPTQEPALAVASAASWNRCDARAAY